MDLAGFERAGLVRAANVRGAGEDPRILRDAARRALLVRVRCGTYCLPERWRVMDGRERHLAHVRAVLADHRGSGIVAGRSAGAVWDLPDSAVWPEPVRLLVPRRAGGSSEGDVRRSFIGVERAEPVRIDEMPVTSLARTACDIARTTTYATAVIVLDAARWRRRPDSASWATLVGELTSSRGERGSRLLDRALQFSTELADSPGESRTRVMIRRLGFIDPVLQARFVDEQGEMFVDFCWPDVGVALEFDGHIKYTRQALTGGDPSSVVWKEKQREDRLRRQLRRVERAIHADLLDARRLARILDAAGVPRRAGLAR